VAGRRQVAGDNELIARMQAGEVAAFDELYSRYYGRARRVAQMISVDGGRAEEAVQEAFSLIWSSRASYRPERPTAAAWVLTVVRNRAIDGTRRDASDRANRAGDAWFEHRAAPHDVADEALGRVLACELIERIALLPAAQREVIVLGFYGDLSHTEIASQLDLPLGTIKARMRRGLRALRDGLADHAG
jgi:RNA polymerase sigma-70 factor (ECF subfamily)